DARPTWLAGYPTMGDVLSTRPASRGVPDEDDAETADPPTARETVPVTLQSAGARAVDTAAGVIPKFARPAGNPKVAALIDSGKKAAQRGGLERAVRDFGEAVRIEPKYADSYAERGQALFKLGETERAIADYTAAIQRDAQNAVAFRARGMAYLY